MPNFGGPAGYGLAQHDPPRTRQELWDFYEHIRVGMEILILTDFGLPAYKRLMKQHALDPASKLDRAIFLREVVRAYNGCREFAYEQGRWLMKPRDGEGNRPPPDRLNYANGVLETAVDYTIPPLKAAVLSETNIDTIAGRMTALL
jgi:hypothetical protein